MVDADELIHYFKRTTELSDINDGIRIVFIEEKIVILKSFLIYFNL